MITINKNSNTNCFSRTILLSIFPVLFYTSNYYLFKKLILSKSIIILLLLDIELYYFLTVTIFFRKFGILKKNGAEISYTTNKI